MPLFILTTAIDPSFTHTVLRKIIQIDMILKAIPFRSDTLIFIAVAIFMMFGIRCGNRNGWGDLEIPWVMISGIIAFIMGMVVVIDGSDHLLAAIKIAIAPRVYLLEQAIHLIRP